MASSAINRLRSIRNLTAVWNAYWKDHSRSAPGIDWVTPKAFNDDLMSCLRRLCGEIANGFDYSSLRAIPIEKKDSDKKRLICIPTVRDRLVQRAVLEKIDARAAKLGIINDVSFGFVRDPSGVKRGVQAARKAAVRQRQLNPWAFKADISAFFDTIDREALIGEFDASFGLKSLLPLVRGAINCEVDDRDPAIRRVVDDNGIHRGRGLRQGMPLSPLLSNFVLRDFDRAFGNQGYRLIRYADDMLVLAGSEIECLRARDLVVTQLDKLGLKVSESKTFICKPADPVEFLGLDLGPKGASSYYELTISKKQIGKIKSAFTRYHDWSVASKEGLTVAALFQRLEQMKGGYSAAYGVAENIRDLNALLAVWANNCANGIYSSIFGSDAVKKLDPSKRRFLMLP